MWKHLRTCVRHATPLVEGELELTQWRLGRRNQVDARKLLFLYLVTTTEQQQI